MFSFKKINSFSLQQADEGMNLKTWWAMLLIYPLARRITVWTVNYTNLTANHITLTSIGFRFLTICCFLQGSRGWLVTGALFFYLAYAFDCTDGTVARLKKSSSEFGRYLDHVSDLFGDILILTALAGSHGLLSTPMYVGMVFMHMAECYISYLTVFALTASSSSASDTGIFALVNQYRQWWFSRNIKSFFSFPDYTAFTFVFCPLLGIPELGLQIGFYFLLMICLYTVFSSFVSIHTGIKSFP